MTQNLRLVGVAATVLCLAGLVSAGCQSRPKPCLYRSPYSQPHSVAVIPFTNQSGSAALDVMAVTDEFYSELQQVEGFTVMPINRALAAMAQLNLNRVNSPGDAMLVAEALECDAVIVGSVTQYDPYPPPRMGMAVQLYLRQNVEQQKPPPEVDPGKLARAGKPFQLHLAEPLEPQSMVIRIFDAGKDNVVEKIKQYAQFREGAQTPYGWEKSTTQRNYLRFVSYEIIGELLALERKRLTAEMQGD